MAYHEDVAMRDDRRYRSWSEPSVGPEPRAHELPVISRREFIVGTAALAGAFVLAVAGCAAGAVPGDSPRVPIRWIRVSTTGLTTGEPRWSEFDIASSGSAAPPPTGTPGNSMPPARGGAWLVLQPDGSVVAFNPACTHQRCFYDWDGARARFACRCHEGYFAVDGNVIGGPPPRALDRYATRAPGPDMVEIGWADRA